MNLLLEQQPTAQCFVKLEHIKRYQIDSGGTVPNTVKFIIRQHMNHFLIKIS